MVLATKMGFVRQGSADDDGDHLKENNNSFTINGKPDYIKIACENSLRRLNIDVIDLYYLRRADKTVPIEESVHLRNWH